MKLLEKLDRQRRKN